MVISFTLRPLYLQDPFEKILCEFLFRSASKRQEKSTFSLLDIQLRYVRFPACILVTVVTELSQLPLSPRTCVI